MNEQATQILRILDEASVPYDVARHPAAYTMEDCKIPERELSCIVPKNLVLTPRNKSAYFLCLLPPDKPFRTADISKQIPSSRLSFADGDDLSRLLNTFAGAASPLGLLFDEARTVRLLMEESLLRLPRLGFHPNDNEYTVAMETETFLTRFLPLTGRVPQMISI
ncbi:MAG: YbaK/EbsC family protein [Christensenellales bacterium]|jgi:Ala-tRNA(Pro) deacylase